MASANVITGYTGHPEDTHSRLYRISLVAIAVPAMLITASGFDPFRVLIFSQVVLSIQLPLTIIPLLWSSRRRAVMGEHRTGTVSTAVGIVVAAVVIGLNMYLLYQTIGG